jgi:hypothetical protein
MNGNFPHRCGCAVLIVAFKLPFHLLDAPANGSASCREF